MAIGKSPRCLRGFILGKSSACAINQNLQVTVTCRIWSRSNKLGFAHADLKVQVGHIGRAVIMPLKFILQIRDRNTNAGIAQTG